MCNQTADLKRGMASRGELVAAVEKTLHGDWGYLWFLKDVLALEVVLWLCSAIHHSYAASFASVTESHGDTRFSLLSRSFYGVQHNLRSAIVGIMTCTYRGTKWSELKVSLVFFQYAP